MSEKYIKFDVSFDITFDVSFDIIAGGVKLDISPKNGQISNFVDVNFKFDISVEMSNFRDIKFEPSIRHINH